MNTGIPLTGRLACAAVIIIAVYSTILIYRWVPAQVRTEALSLLQEQLSSGEHEKSLLTIEILERSVRPLELLPFPPFTAFSPLDWRNFITRLSRKIELLHLIENNQIDEETIRSNLALLNPDERGRLIEQLKEIRLLDKKINVITSQLELTDSQRNQFAQATFLLLNDLRNLLNFPPNPVTAEGISFEQLEFYQSGFLENLPIIKEISASPENAEELRQALITLKIPLPKISAEDFFSRISSLKQTGAEVRSKIRTLREETEKIVSEQEKALTNRDNFLLEARKTAILTINNYIRTWI
jgi:hypothetical protein